MKAIFAAAVDLGMVALVFGGMAFFLYLTLRIVEGLLFVCPPHHLVVLRRGLTGSQKIVRGVVIRIPFLDQLETLPLEAHIVPIKANGAQSKGGLALSTHALYGITRNPDHQPHAVKRFLGIEAPERDRAAIDAIEGNLRELMATWQAEDIDVREREFVKALLQCAEADMQALGLELLNVFTLHLEDEEGVLEAFLERRLALIATEAPRLEAQLAVEAPEAQLAVEAPEASSESIPAEPKDEVAAPAVQQEASAQRLVLEAAGDVEFLVIQALQKQLACSEEQAEAFVARAQESGAAVLGEDFSPEQAEEIERALQNLGARIRRE